MSRLEGDSQQEGHQPLQEQPQAVRRHFPLPFRRLRPETHQPLSTSLETQDTGQEQPQLSDIPPRIPSGPERRNSRPYGEHPAVDFVEGVIEDSVDEVVENIEASPELAFVLVQKGIHLLDHIPGFKGTRQFVGREVGKVHDWYLEKRVTSLVEHPNRPWNRITTGVILRQAFEEALPTRQELKEESGKSSLVAMGLNGLQRLGEGISALPILTIPIPPTVNPVTHFILQHAPSFMINLGGISLSLTNDNFIFRLPWQTLKLTKNIPIFINQAATFLAVSGIRALRDLKKMRPMGAVVYAAAAIADMAIPLFNPLFFSIGIDKAVSVHYDRRRNLFFEKAAEKLLQIDEEELRDNVSTHLDALVRRFAKRSGQERQTATTEGVQRFLQSEEEYVNRPVQMKPLRTKEELGRLRYYGLLHPVWNKFKEYTYKKKLARKAERLDAGEKLSGFLHIVNNA